MYIANMQKWRNHTFSSGSYAGPDFKSFAKSFRYYVKKNVEEIPGATLEVFNVGHYDVFGFIKGANGKYVYFSISDVRYFPGEWYKHILIRTATDAKDYHGGPNNHTTLERFVVTATNLLKS